MTTAIGAYTTRTRVKARLSITTTDWDSQIDTVVDSMNAYIEGPQGCGRIIAPISSATYLLDGTGLTHLYFPKGVRAITELKIGSTTGATLDTITATDYFIRPLAQDRPPAWPAFYVFLSDRPTGTHSVFAYGRENVSMTCTAGWAAIPDELAEMADAIASTTFHTLEQGNQPIPNTDEQGRPIVHRFVSGRDRDTMRAYRVKQPGVIGTRAPAIPPSSWL